MVKRVQDPEAQEEVVQTKKYQRPCCPKEGCNNSGKRKTRCAIHGGSELCPVTCVENGGKEKAYCKEHGGSALCLEYCVENRGKPKSRCEIHGGSALCPADCPRAGKYKALCDEHGGWKLCPVTCVENGGKRKVRCTKHGGSALCPIDCVENGGKEKACCAIHGGSALCPPTCIGNGGNKKAYCAEHGGSRLCVGCKLMPVQKMGDFCRTCVPIASSHARVREAKMAATLKKWASGGLIPEVNSWNKQNPTAEPLQCGRFRPDFVYEWNEGVLVLEFDEQMHSDRPKQCELDRMEKVTLGYGDRPVFWVRFNPDAFKVDGETLTTTRKTREEVLLKMLQDTIGHADYDHFMTVCYLFYDKPKNTREGNYVQKFQFKTIQEYESWVDSEVLVDEVVPE